MSGFIAVNFENVPDKEMPLPPGVYNLTIVDAGIEPTKRDPGKNKLVVEMELSDPTSEHNGRRVFDHIPLSRLTRVKRLMLSAGVNPSQRGLEVSELVGKTVKVSVDTREYADEVSGETRETNQVRDYLF